MIAYRLLNLHGDQLSVKRLAGAVNVMLGILLAYQVTALMGFVDDQYEVPLSMDGANAPPRAVQKPDKHTAIAPDQAHLFGEPLAAGRQDAVAEAPEVRPSLILRGIIHSTNTGAARAIITQSDGRDVAYPLGARLPGGRRLSKINYRDVVVSHHGREELLTLSKKVAPES
jgi:type II secretory pathway component PulC